MANIREKIAKNAAPHLEPGETIQQVFGGQTANQWLFILGGIFFMLSNNYRTVAVTDRRILIMDSGKWTTTKAKSVVHSVPRNTQIGPASGLWYRCENLPERLFIHKRYHKDVLAADQMIGA
ncbi:MAG: hypothetical protein R2706_06565 [Acidimicrobiales bacterium]